MIIPESYEQFPEGTYGYVYQTTHIPSGKKYVGKKALIYNQKKKIGKREAALWEGKGRPPVYKQVQKESDWKTYYGSHQFIKDEINLAFDLSFIYLRHEGRSPYIFARKSIRKKQKRTRRRRGRI